MQAVRRLDRRVVSESFYWHEIEEEIRDRHLDWTFFGDVDKMKDDFMEHIDHIRRVENYTHPESDCSDMCKSKGN